MDTTATSSHPTTAPHNEQAGLVLIVLASFFPETRRALQVAGELAARLRARLVLLHVDQLALVDDNLHLAKPAAATREMRQALQVMAADLPVPAAIELTDDLLPRVIDNLTRRYGPALYVLGRPAAERADFAMGAAVLDVLRHARLPLLLVPETYDGPTVPEHLAVATDDAPFALAPGAAPARRLLHQLAPAHLTVVTVSPMQDDAACAAALHQVRASGLLHTRATHLGVEGFYDTQADEGTLQAIDTLQADWLVVLAREHSVLGSLFHRSITNRLLLRSPVPVLAVPATEGEPDY